MPLIVYNTLGITYTKSYTTYIGETGETPKETVETPKETCGNTRQNSRKHEPRKT